MFHTKCIQNGGVLQLPCHPSVGSGSRKNKQSRKSARLLAGAVQASTGGSSHSHAQAKFNLQGTSEFTDSTDKIISGIKELQLMQDFITKKVMVFFVYNYDFR